MFSQTAEYALRAMACLAQTPDRLVSTPDLAKQTQVPANYLAKVLQQIAGAGLVTGRRGVGGGYKLARPASQIKLLEVLNSVSSVKRIETCPMGLHGTNLCALHRISDRAIKAVMDIFDDTTLQDLLNDPSGPRPLCADKPTNVTISAA